MRISTNKVSSVCDDQSEEKKKKKEKTVKEPVP
jgi:hypothetical protein